MLSLIAIPLWASVPDAPERCLSLASPAISRRILVSGALASEVVMVPDRLTAPDVAALAEALRADAVPIGDAWRLLRRPEALRALREADRTWFKTEVAAAVERGDDLYRPLAARPVEAPFAAMRAERTRFETTKDAFIDNSGRKASEVAPGTRLLAGLLRSLPPDVLDGVEPGQRRIFSNAAVGSEKPLRIAPALLAEYEAAQRRLADWTIAAPAEKIPPSYRWAFPPKGFLPGPRTVQVLVNRLTAEPTLGIIVYDPEGTAEAEGGLPASPSRERLGARDSSEGRLGRARLPESAWTALSGTAPYEGGLIEAADLDPLLREPLDLYVRDALQLWARAKGFGRVVACVPDGLLAAVRTCAKDGEVDLDALSDAIEAADCETFARKDILVLRPRHPLQEEAQRVDRRPLSALCRAAARGTFGLRDLTAYHAAYADRYGSLVALSELERPIRDRYGLVRDPNWTLPHALLATLGKLSPGERTALYGGRPVPLASPAFDVCLTDLARFASTFSKPSPFPPPTGDLVFRAPPMASVSGSDLDRSPARLLAASNGASISGAPGPTTILVRRVSKASGQVVDPDLIPIGFVAATAHELDVSGGEVLNRSGYEVLDRLYRLIWTQERSLSVRISLGRTAQAGPFLLRERSGGSSSPVSLDDVPGVVRP